MMLLTFEIPAGPIDTYCLPIEIVNDTVTLEGDEMFSIQFMTLPEGVTPGSVPESVITINDDDDESKSYNLPNCNNVYKNSTASCCAPNTAQKVLDPQNYCSCADPFPHYCDGRRSPGGVLCGDG